MHKTLSNLIQMHLPNVEDLLNTKILMDAISTVLDDLDEGRNNLEKTLTNVSVELQVKNEYLKAQLEELTSSKLLLQRTVTKQKTLIDAIPEAIIVFNPGGTIDQINPEGIKLVGIDKNTLLTMSADELLEHWLSLHINPEKFKKDISRVDPNNRQTLHGFFDFKNGRKYEYFSGSERLEHEYWGRIWCIRDITELQKQQDFLRHQAYHDVLTGLPNRLHLLDSMEHAISLAKRRGDKLGIMFIDLDGFKKINDTSGHDVGDEFLLNTTKKIKSGLRSSDILARKGGDEFVVVIEQVSSIQYLNDIATKLLVLISEPHFIEGLSHQVSCSIGISLYPNDDNSADELIRKADMAMYAAKENGKNRYYYFDPSLERIAIHRVAMENQIRLGIESEEFSLVYQPKISLLTNQIISVEGLIRWHRPNSEIVFPDDFIPIAERDGKIKEITQLVLKIGCDTLERWHNTAKSNIGVSINVSAIDIGDPHFIGRVESTLKGYNFKKELLEFELTESVFLEKLKNVQPVIDQLKSLGLRLSIDDFGSGYANFSYLLALEIDVLKIDKTLTQNANNSARSGAILKSIVDIGKHLDMSVIAEGVETKEELEFLMNTGCHYAQGYYFSKPIGLTELEAFIESWNKNSD